MAMDIVVVNYHTPDDLHQFLESLKAYPPSDPWTVTIIDVETRFRRELVRNWPGGVLRVLGEPENIGYGRACNLGAVQGDDEIIALFNADVEITPGSLDLCASGLAEHDQWAILGPCQVDSHNRIRHAGIFGTPVAPKHRGWNEVNRGQFCDVREAVTVSGSAFFVKRKVWSELTDCSAFQEVAPEAEGAFLPTPHYYEETWASYHARAHGHQVVYFGEATMIHKWHRASRVGGRVDQQMPVSRAMFRRACDAHGIGHD
jgi:GT2 family glycosyltransferase